MPLNIPKNLTYILKFQTQYIFPINLSITVIFYEIHRHTIDY